MGLISVMTAGRFGAAPAESVGRNRPSSAPGVLPVRTGPRAPPAEVVEPPVPLAVPPVVPLVLPPPPVVVLPPPLVPPVEVPPLVVVPDPSVLLGAGLGAAGKVTLVVAGSGEGTVPDEP